MMNTEIHYPIIISITSWKQRINCVSKCIVNLLNNQTIKPNKIILHLSELEFPNKEKDLPNDLNILINQHIIDLYWMKNNIYCHKKYETFKLYKNAYIILADDDIIYPSDYIESLINTCIFTNNKYVCCYYTTNISYNNGIRKYIGLLENPSFKNTLFSGLACFPPNIFPMESFNYEYMRNLLSEKCDDSWINGWLIKNNIKIYGISEFKNSHQLITFNNSQDVGIWKLYNSKMINNIPQKYMNFINVINFLNLNNIAKELWPNININKYLYS